MRRMSTVRMDNRPRVERGGAAWLGDEIEWLGLPFQDQPLVRDGGGSSNSNSHSNSNTAFKPEQEPISMLLPDDPDDFRLCLAAAPIDSMENELALVTTTASAATRPENLLAACDHEEPYNLPMSPSSPGFDDLSPEEKLQVRRRKRAFAERQRVQTRKQEIQKMKDQMQHLQRQYDALCVQADYQLRRSHPPVPNMDPLVVPPFHSLRLVTEEIKRLRRENAFLEERIKQNYQLRGVLHMLVKEMEDSLVVERPVAMHRRVRGELNGFVFLPYSVDECHELIAQHLQRELGAHAIKQATRVAADDHLGWTGFRAIENQTRVKFDQTKTWRGTASEVFGRSWNLSRDTKDLQRSLTSPRHLELLQRVSDDILIFRRISENVRNGTINHSVYMVYRVRRGDAFLNGLVSLPLWGNVQEVHDDPLGRSQLGPQETCVKFQKLSCYAPEPSRPDMMRVRHWGVYDCDTEDDARFWLDEILDLQLRYEFLLLFPVACAATQTAQLEW